MIFKNIAFLFLSFILHTIIPMMAITLTIGDVIADDATNNQQSSLTPIVASPWPLLLLLILSLSLALSLSLSYHTHDSHTITPSCAPPSPSMMKLTTSGYCHFDTNNTYIISPPRHSFLPLSFQKFQKW